MLIKYRFWLKVNLDSFAGKNTTLTFIFRRIAHQFAVVYFTQTGTIFGTGFQRPIKLN